MESTLLAFVFMCIVCYIIALGFGILFSGARGVTGVNKVARRVIALPVSLLGHALIGLATLIRG